MTLLVILTLTLCFALSLADFVLEIDIERILGYSISI